MILTLIAILAATILSLISWKWKYDFFCGWSAFFAPLFIFTGITALVIYGMAALGYVTAITKAELINREYGTSYTAKEVFFASDVIDTIRHIDRKRIEIDGNFTLDEE